MSETIEDLIPQNDQGTRLWRYYLRLINRSNPTFGPQNIKGHLNTLRAKSPLTKHWRYSTLTICVVFLR